MKFLQHKNGTMELWYHKVALLLNLNINESVCEKIKSQEWVACLMSSVELEHGSDKKALDLPYDLPMYVTGEHDAHKLTKMGFTNVTVLTEGGLNIHGIQVKTIGKPNAVATGKMTGLVMTAPDEKSVLVTKTAVTHDEICHDIEQTHAEVIIIDGSDPLLDKNDLLKDQGRLEKNLEDINRIAKEEPHYMIIVTHLNRFDSAHLAQEQVKHWLDRIQKKHWVLVPQSGEFYEY